MTEKYSDTLEYILGFLKESGETLRMAQADQRDAEDLSQDLLHELELSEHLTYHEMANIAKREREARKARRAAKDVIAVVGPIATWVAQYAPVIKALEKLLGDVRREEDRLANRYYRPRCQKEAES